MVSSAEHRRSPLAKQTRRVLALASVNLAVYRRLDRADVEPAFLLGLIDLEVEDLAEHYRSGTTRADEVRRLTSEFMLLRDVVLERARTK